MTETLLQARSVGKVFREGGRELRVLDGVDLEIADGECVAILGRSGSGKSTLLHLLGGLDRPTSGAVFFRGTDVFAMHELAIDRYRSGRVGFVFQQYHLLPELSAWENVRLASMIGRGRRDADSAKPSKRAPKERAAALLERVGLGDRLSHKPAKLSGGERQRVAIARALMNEPSVLLADEPTGNLDADTGASVMALFEELHDGGQTMVLVTHDAKVAARADRMVTLAGGRLVSAGAESGVEAPGALSGDGESGERHG
ncbi:MAG: ABC transporter ATP-binding protein [Planctomycetota bacterium]